MSGRNPHLVEFEAYHRVAQESIIEWCLAQRSKQGLNGIAILTNKRVAFFRKGMMSMKFEPWPLEKVSSVESRKGLMFFEFKLYTSGDAMDLRTADKDAGQRFVMALQSQLAALTSKTDASPQSDAGDPIERLEKLAKLKDAGIVSEAEYEKLRQQILSSI